MEKILKKINSNIFFKTALWMLGLGIIAIMVHLAGWEAINRAILSLNPAFLLLLCFFQACTLALSSYQLYYIMDHSKIKLPFSKVFKIYLTGTLVESITPSLKFGGEAAKIYLLKRSSMADYNKIAGIFIVYKLVSFIPFLIIIFISAGLAYFKLEINIFIHAAIILFIATTALLLFFYLRKNNSKTAKPFLKIQKFLTQAFRFSSSILTRGQFAKMIAISCFIWLAYPLKLYIITRLLNININFLSLAPMLYASYVISMLPLAPGGLGSFEGSMVFLLGRISVSAQNALTVVLLSRFITYWFPLFLSALFAVFLFANLKSFSQNQLER